MQLPFAGTLPPLSVSEPPPAAAVTVPLQPAPLIAAAGAAVFTRPPGYASVNAAPVTATPFGLVSVIFTTEVSPVPIEPGVKALPAVIGAAPLTTPSVAIEAVPVPALVVVTGPLVLM